MTFTSNSTEAPIKKSKNMIKEESIKTPEYAFQTKLGDTTKQGAGESIYLGWFSGQNICG